LGASRNKPIKNYEGKEDDSIIILKTTANPHFTRDKIFRRYI